MRTACFSDSLYREGGGGVCLWVQGVSTTPLTTPLPPWTEWLTDRCKNITLRQTSFAGGNKRNTTFFTTTHSKFL